MRVGLSAPLQERLPAIAELGAKEVGIGEDRGSVAVGVCGLLGRVAGGRR